MDRTVLERKALAELREIASTLELRGYQRMKKADLVDLIVNNAGDNGGEPAARPAERDGGRPDADAGTTTEADRAAAAPADTADRDEEDAAARGDDAERVRARRRGDDDGRGEDRPEGDGDGADRGDERQRTRARHRDDGDAARSRDTDTRERRDQRDEDTDDGEDAEARRPDARGDGQRDGGQGPRDGGPGGARSRSKRDRRRKGRGSGQQQQQEDLSDAEVREGVLDLLPEGYGFLRCTGYLSGNKDVYVSQSFVRRFGLRRGDLVAGPIRRNKNNDKFPALARIDTIEGEKVGDQPPKRVEFADLTPLFPDERLRLEVEERSPISMRIVDMMAPIGKGQRGLIVSPPKAGKTTILKQLAAAIETNNPEVHLMVVLVDERPEEVTDFERSTSGEVVSSTFDRPADDHTQAAELTIERAKRLVERGRDVVILLDSITRLGRAYNLAAPASGRILSGGIDSAALYPPKRFFGAARNIENGGSLTIIATALIETGSKMDEVIFEEFKGTGNMELRLDRKMEQKRIFPAVDIQASGTRREELLLEPAELETVWKLRRLLATMDSDAAIQLLIDKLRATRSNDQFLQMIAKSTLQ